MNITKESEEIMSGYPLGASYDRDAPYNQPDIKPKKIKVLVSMTLSKEVDIMVDNYNIKDDEIDLSEVNLKELVEQQIHLPSDNNPLWSVDEFEVVEA